jgi:hypothetical protein
MGLSLSRVGDFIANNAKFEVSRGDDQIAALKKDPERMFMGPLGATTVGTKLSNRVLGTDYDPIVNQLGGPTNKQFSNAAAAGIDTRDAGLVHTIIHAIVSFYAGGYFGGELSAETGLSSGASSNILSGLGAIGAWLFGKKPAPAAPGSPLNADVRLAAPTMVNPATITEQTPVPSPVVPLVILAGLTWFFFFRKG